MQIDWFPLWLSLRVAFISTAIALALGLWLAYILANKNFRAKEALDAAVTLPLVLPPTVLGYRRGGTVVSPRAAATEETIVEGFRGGERSITRFSRPKPPEDRDNK